MSRRNQAGKLIAGACRTKLGARQVAHTGKETYDNEWEGRLMKIDRRDFLKLAWRCGPGFRSRQSGRFGTFGEVPEEEFSLLSTI